MKTRLLVTKLISAIVTIGFWNSAQGGTAALPTLSIILGKTQYVAGEPLIVHLKLVNESPQALLRLFSSNEDFASTTAFIFTVRASDGADVGEFKIAGAHGSRIAVRMGIFLSDPKFLLQPGEFWQCEHMFVPRRNLQEKVRRNGQSPVPVLLPGVYKLTARLGWQPPEGEGVYITSNTVDFDIKEATGVNAEAVSLMEAPDVGGFFMGFVGGKPKAITELLERYPESVYARYARLRLILDEARRIWQTTRSAEDTEYLERLTSEGLAYAEQNKDDPLSDNVLLYCARLTRLLDKEEESLEILRRLEEEFPESDAVEAAQRHLEQWDRPLKPGEKAEMYSEKPVPVDEGGRAKKHLTVSSYTLVMLAVSMAAVGSIVLAIALKRKASKSTK